jgi:hypothetical protein
LKAITVRGLAFLVAVGAFAFFASSANAQSRGTPPSPECLLSNPSISGLNPISVCLSTVYVNSNFSKVTYSVTGCVFTCYMDTLDKAFTAIGCDTGAIGAPPTSEVNTLSAKFSDTDHIYHTVGILTSIVAPNGFITSYNSPTIGTQCK